jgi:hypothetical protein|tara:strand:- start:1257 stop:1430 length:174 start_codon:yes stop_codon:yes gene_type:complete
MMTDKNGRLSSDEMWQEQQDRKREEVGYEEIEKQMDIEEYLADKSYEAHKSWESLKK